MQNFGAFASSGERAANEHAIRTYQNLERLEWRREGASPDPARRATSS
jgi:hypothetical protein